MSFNNNYQDIKGILSYIEDVLYAQRNDILCNDCGGIIITNVQHLLTTLEDTTELFNPTSISNSTIKNKVKVNKRSHTANIRSKSEKMKTILCNKNNRKASSRRNIRNNNNRVANTNK